MGTGSAIEIAVKKGRGKGIVKKKREVRSSAGVAS